MVAAKWRRKIDEISSLLDNNVRIGDLGMVVCTVSNWASTPLGPKQYIH